MYRLDNETQGVPESADSGTSMNESTIGQRRWAIVALSFAAIMLNYVDRQMIALLKPTLQAEFGWSNRAYSHMASAFQISAALAFLGTGWFIDRIGLRKGFAVGVGGWSLAAMAHALVGTTAGFIGVRIALGTFEAVGTPAQIKTASAYFPAERRTMIIGIGNMAANLGAVVAPLMIPPLALRLGWRAAFLIAGGLGPVWVLLWLAVRPPPEIKVADGVAARVPWLSMLSERRQWALIAAKALSDEVWWFLLFFTPDLFHGRFGVSQAGLGRPVAFVYLMAAVGSLSGGYLPAWLLRHGVAAARARKLSLFLYALLILPLPLLLRTHSEWTGAGLLALALFAHQGFSTNIFALSADLFSARTVGTAVGIAAFAGNLSGMAMIEAAGWSLDHRHGYGPLLGVCSVSYLLALLCIQWLVPEIGSAGRPSTAAGSVLLH